MRRAHHRGLHLIKPDEMIMQAVMGFISWRNQRHCIAYTIMMILLLKGNVYL